MPSLTDEVKNFLKGQDHTVGGSETLAAIAKRYGMSEKQLKEFKGDTAETNSSRLTKAKAAKAPKIIKVPKFPANVAACPASVTIPADLAKVMQEQWEKSVAMVKKVILVAPKKDSDFNLIHMDQNAREHGGILTWVVADGKLEFIRVGGGRTASYPLDLSLAAGRYILGSLHTHPYTRWVDGDDMDDVAYSGTDLQVYMASTVFLDFVQSNEMRFLCMQTQQTSRSSAVAAQAKSAWTTEFANHYTDYKRQTFVKAAYEAAKKVCTDYKMAFYQAKGTTLAKQN